MENDLSSQEAAIISKIKEDQFLKDLARVAISHGILYHGTDIWGHSGALLKQVFSGLKGFSKDIVMSSRPTRWDKVAKILDREIDQYIDLVK